MGKGGARALGGSGVGVGEMSPLHFGREKNRPAIGCDSLSMRIPRVLEGQFAFCQWDAVVINCFHPSLQRKLHRNSYFLRIS